MSTHPVIPLVINGTTNNVYINTDAGVWSPIKTKIIVDYLSNLHTKYLKELGTGAHHVVILWGMNGKQMADIWIFGKKESEGAGASVWVYNFEGLDRYESANVSAADGMVILGKEAKKYL